MLDVNFIKIAELKSVVVVHVEAMDMKPVCQLADALHAAGYDNVLLIQHIYGTNTYQIVLKKVKTSKDKLLEDIRNIIHEN